MPSSSHGYLPSRRSHPPGHRPAASHIGSAVVWLLIPNRRTCPHRHETTERYVLPLPLQVLRLERRCCLECGWRGIAKRRPSTSAQEGRSAVPIASLLIVLGISGLGCAPPQDEVAALFADSSAWIDLTYSYNAQTIYWPTAEPFGLEQVASGVTEAGYYYAANNFSAAEHGGTHFDAPIHFAEGKPTADQIPLSRLIGPAVVIDVEANASANADYLVSIADFEAFEAVHGPMPDGAIVLLRTGWGRHWPDAAAYLGTDVRGEDAIPLLHFPGLEPTAARWLVEERSIAALGIDTPSIDYGQSSDFESHQVLLAAEIPAFENVANLDRMPEAGGYVIALPMKIEGGSGGPLRIVGVVPTR
ncbi:MAG: cyclase family protein [Gemmatimonadales bacterium]|nr:cyclase family protein [Gemmatimonadales bacterium]NIN11778.1 cyclase family protein [Gemmatimonadales bacterium]NIN50334.1 cyclase family protein [Gemmatimonadales bacterium]NIP07798.1 cyclase family protein [Gemmatimonadales bacterium]NIQ99230.1 cyclase family protein [Gemmatimonadales bacterium]